MLINSEIQVGQLRAKLFSGFADTSRLSILIFLAEEGTSTVSEIIEATGLSQSNTSNHLNCLFDCGLVTKEQKGRYVHYSLSDPRISQLLHLSDQILADVARGVYECTRYNLLPADLSQ